MTARRPIPGAYRLLEWDVGLINPGSRVHDAAGQMIYTGSPVHPARASRGRRTAGTVVALLSPVEVTVHWVAVCGLCSTLVAVADRELRHAVFHDATDTIEAPWARS